MLRIILGILTLALAAPALADQPNYNLIDLSYQAVDLDLGGGIDVDGDGPGISGSFEVAPNWHVLGGYTTAGFDGGVDLNQLEVGVGYHTAISDTTSFFASVLWVNFEVEASGFGSADESGAGLSIGLRSNVTDAVELAGSITHVDLGGGADGTSLDVGGWYDLSDTFALGLIASFDDDTTVYGISGRFTF